jgi:hypothetical protein
MTFVLNKTTIGYMRQIQLYPISNDEISMYFIYLSQEYSFVIVELAMYRTCEVKPRRAQLPKPPFYM